MDKKYLSGFLVLITSSFFAWSCSQTYSLGPLPPAVATATFTSTFTATHTPCGYPGNTCTFTHTPTATFTFTPTFTFTATNTPTITNTFTVTNTPTATSTFTATYTPTPLPSPRGLFGIQDNQNYPTLVWVKDTNPNITSYKIYVSTDDVNWVLLANPNISAFPGTFCQVNDTTQAAPFTRYYYIVASNGGTPPDSPPSPEVWAVSGTATNNAVTYTVTAPPLTCTHVSGSVPGAVNRVWIVEDVPQNQYWAWGEGGTTLPSVTYGYNTGGLTYLPPQTLTSGTIYGFGTFTLNNHNWVIDTSAQGFRAP